MEKKLLFIFFGMFLLLAQAIAQDITITGKVSDGDRNPLPGVSIKQKGKNSATQTSIDGTYTIKASTNDVLVFSYIGFITLERTVGTKTTIDVALAEDSKVLNEVVIVGYGTQKKESLTGAITSVNVEKVFGNRPIPDVARGLQGAVPGLSVVVPSGEVGSDPIIKIRGQVGSLIGNNNPLILVDNVEIPSMQLVNPNDIENITILKDAASSAIYGSKAAFGVVLITTKKGTKTDGNKFVYSNNFVMQSPFKPIDVAGIDGLQYTVDAHQNMKGVGPAGGFWRVDTNSLKKIREWETKYGGVIGNDDPLVYGRDWYWDGSQKFGYRVFDPVAAMVKNNTLSQQHNIGLNGKSGNTSYNLSIGYLGQEGMMKPAKHDDYKRLTPSLSITTKATDYITLRGGARYADATKRNPASLNSAGFGADPWIYLYRWSRLFPIGVKEQDADIIDPAFSARMSNDQIRNEKYLNMNLGATINLTKAWDITADYANSTENNLISASVPYVQGRTHWYGVEALRDANGQVYVDENGEVTDATGMMAYRFPLTDHVTKANTYFRQANSRSVRNTLNALTNYRLDLKEHQFKFLLGTNIIGFERSDQFSQKNNLINSENPQFDFAPGIKDAGGDAYWDAQAGFFGRVNYAFDDKYLLEGTVRRDGTSKFSQRLQWRTYPGVSGGWVISKENFMEGIRPVLSFAKLRASWGFIGDQSVPSGTYIPQMYPRESTWLGGDGNPYYTFSTPDAVDKTTRWQDIEHMNLGVDLRFFESKLGVSAEVFQRYTRDMLVAGEALPPTFGIGAPQGNYGDLRTRGWEFGLDFSHQFDNGLRLTVDANIGDAVSFITKAADNKTPLENRSLGAYNSFITGRRYGDVYGYVTDRLFQKEDFVYDANGNFVQTTIVVKGVSKVTNQLVGDNPVYQTAFEDGNQTMLISPGDVKFVDVNGDGYIDAGNGTIGDPGDRVVIGNTTPRYEYGFRLGGEFKGIELSLIFQGVGQRKIWGKGQLAIPGYHVKDGAMPQAIAGDYWREDRTDAFYPRAWNSNGEDDIYVMKPQSRYMLDMSYLKIKNITLAYNLPTSLVQRVKIASVKAYVSLENFITFDNLRGLPIDPEAISGVSGLRSTNYNQGRTGTSNPAFKSASAGLQIGF